jgi:hypothetical protein
MPHRYSAPLALATVVGVLLLPPSSYGDTTKVADDDDTHGRLDIARVTHTHGHHRLVHTIRMQAGWKARVLRKGRLTVMFKSGSRYRTIELDFRRRRGLVATICRDERLTGGELVNCSDDVALDRPDGRTVTVTVRKRQVRKPGRQGYKWQVTSFLQSGQGECPQGRLCVDSLPGAEPWIRHGLRH